MNKQVMTLVLPLMGLALEPACSATVVIADDGEATAAAEPGGAEAEPLEGDGGSCVVCSGAGCGLCPVEGGTVTYRCQDSAAVPLPTGCVSNGSLFQDGGGFYVCVMCNAG